MGDMADYYKSYEDPIQKRRPIPAGHYRVHPLNLDTPRRINEFLAQDKFWVNAGLEKIRIKDMDSDYLLSTMIWLLKRAPEVFLVMNMFEGIDDGLCPHYQIQQTTLFMKLRERYTKLVG